MLPIFSLDDNFKRQTSQKVARPTPNFDQCANLIDRESIYHGCYNRGRVCDQMRLDTRVHLSISVAKGF